jgi:abortive infection bacteriophage resistance protein
MYNKQPLTIAEQIALLKSRGLQILPADDAEHLLSNISYYRLAEYWSPFQISAEVPQFKKGSRFADVIALYNFDRKLRALLYDIIGRIETSLRSKMIYHLSHEHGPWWFENLSLFTDPEFFQRSLDIIRLAVNRSEAELITAHQKKYERDSRLPPASKSLEEVSLSALAKIYSNLDNRRSKSKDVIAKEWGLTDHTFMPSWLQTITQIRNAFAHYERLWNRPLPAKPKMMHQPPYPWIKNLPVGPAFDNLYIHLCCVKYLLNRVHPQNNFTRSLSRLLDSYPDIGDGGLGFTEGWEREGLWATGGTQS